MQTHSFSTQFCGKDLPTKLRESWGITNKAGMRRKGGRLPSLSHMIQYVMSIPHD